MQILRLASGRQRVHGCRHFRMHNRLMALQLHDSLRHWTRRIGSSHKHRTVQSGREVVNDERIPEETAGRSRY